MMAFEWDDKKNTLNRQKHGIDFSMAIAVFDDPNRLEEDSMQPEHGEIRIRTIGMAGSSVLVLTVIYTDRYPPCPIFKGGWGDLNKTSSLFQVS